jgi:uncharacterized membrane protein HdeD (DUF308 family)
VINPRRTSNHDSDTPDSSRAGVTLPRHADWSPQLGAAFILLGTASLITARTSAAASVVPFAWLLVTGGLVEGIHAFYVRRTDRFFLDLVPAIAAVPVALLMVAHPSAGALPWMWQFATFFTVVGLFRIVAAIRLHLANRSWVILDSAVTLGFAVVLWAGWSWLLPWFLGVAVGVSLLLRGVSAIMLAFSLRTADKRRVTEESAHPNVPMLGHSRRSGSTLREFHNKTTGR